LMDIYSSKISLRYNVTQKIHVFSVSRHPMLPAVGYAWRPPPGAWTERIVGPTRSLLGLQVTLPFYHEE
jgi:hypothetical protein